MNCWRWLAFPVVILSWTVQADNLLPDGGFEAGLGAWQLSFGAATCVQVVDQGAHGGTHCVQVTCREQIGGVDSPRLPLGEDLPRQGTYRLRAALRNGGIAVGDFGLRLYFYSATGEFLAMHGGIVVRGTQPGDWQEGEIAFGRGTDRPIPPAAATMLVRFSLWAPAPGATGTAWLDDVTLERLAGDPVIQRAPLAWLWQEKGLPDVPANLGAAIQSGGFQADPKTAAELVASGALRAENTDLLVLPYGESYPVELASLLPDFCLGGGAVLTLGGAPFRQPLYQTAQGLRALAAGDEVLAALPADVAWEPTNCGPEDAVTAEASRQGWQLSFELQSYAYGKTAIAPLSAKDAVLELTLRGDEATPRVCLEFHEQDGSRWKRILPLTTTWSTHRFHLAECAAYASKERGGSDDWLHPERLAQVLVGTTKAMVGPGEHRVELRNVRFLRAEVPSVAVSRAPRFVPEELTAARWFGAEHTREPWAIPPPVRIVGEELTRSRLRRVADGTLAKGDWRVWQVADVTPAASGKRRPLARVLAERNAAFNVPLLTAGNRIGNEIPCAALTVHREGPLAGSRWATFAFANGPGELPEPIAQTVAEAARALAGGIWLQGPQPVFRIQDGQVVMDVVLPVANPSPSPARLSVALRQGERSLGQHPVTLPARHAASVTAVLAQGLPVPNLEEEGLDLTVEVVEATGPVSGPRTFTLDLVGQLRAICDFMVEQAKDDGKLHGFSFIDNRGMRTLLGGYEILGDREYLRTALRWGELMMAEQREDGGYRMGYGITRKGEECYVADGGEIVVGILRLVSYTHGGERARLLESAARYMAYREEFRVPTGGIGVGWCLQDYGKRPIVPLAAPTRIYSPENNTYTIGCSLAGAYGYAALRGKPELERQAEADADWLMARANRLHGAFIESYIFAHAFATTPERRQLYADYIQRAFLVPMASSSASWWLDGGGRSALNLDGLAYGVHRLGAGPEVRAEMYRALCAMYSPQSPQSVPNVIGQGDFDHDRWIYICYGTLGLVDVLKPMASIDGWR